MAVVVGLLPHAVGLLRDAVLHLRPSLPILLVAPHVGVARVLPRHERGPRGGAHGTARVGLGEAHAFGGHAVDVGRGYEGLSVAAEVAVAHVVAEDEEDIGAAVCLGSRGLRHEEQG